MTLDLRKRLYYRFTVPVKAPVRMASSATYMYPFQGVCYFVTHPQIWPFYITILIPQLFLTLVIYVIMYVTLYPVEAFLSLLFYGPAGLISAWFTVLQQSGVISAFIVTFLLMPEIQKVAFDAVLSREYSDDVVLMAKLRRQNKVPFLARCGQVVWSLPAKLILPYTLLKTILLLIISAIPLIGPLLVIFIQAPTKGLQAHARYFSLKGYDQKQIKQIYRLNTGQYMGFGVVANFLESIPLLSVFFMFTNTVGAALWVIDIEKGQKSLYGINEHVDYVDLKAHDPLISQPLPEEPQDEIVEEDSKKEKEL